MSAEDCRLLIEDYVEHANPKYLSTMVLNLKCVDLI